MNGLNYRELIQQILKGHAVNHLNTDTELQLLFDTNFDHYQVLHLGWQDLKRVYGCIIHVDIKDSKFWIQRDGTEIGVANELVSAGVPKQDIVLAFKAPYKRKYTEYALN
jgi:XisI protein